MLPLLLGLLVAVRGAEARAGPGAGCAALAARRVTQPPPTSCYLDLAGLIAGLAGGWPGQGQDVGQIVEMGLEKEMELSTQTLQIQTVAQ